MALPPLAPATAVVPHRLLGRRRRGAAAVEFAMVAPVALLMILGSIEFGRAMFVHMLAVNTARTACRQASLSSATNDSVTTSAEDLLSSLGISNAQVVILVDGEEGQDLSTAAPAQPVTVTVTIPYSENSWLPSPFFLGGKSLSGSVTMCKE
jgi:Flp pilus assembly protein TadG